MPEIVQTILRILNDLGTLVLQLGELLAGWLLLIAWLGWWLCGVNWRKLWPVLAQGAWAPVVLLIVIGSLVWSQIAPSECSCLKIVSIPNFWWQLGEVSLLAASALLCGWLQGIIQWTPGEVSVEPALHGHSQEHN